MQVQSRSGGRVFVERRVAELLQRDPQPRGLLLQERAGARRAGLVHLEVDDHVAVEADVLGVLPADLEDRVDIVGIRQRAAGLGGDLVPDQVRADVVAGEVAPAAGGGGGDLADLVALAPRSAAWIFAERIAHGRERVAVGAAVVARQHDDLAVDLRHQRGLGADGADVDAQRGALELSSGLRLGSVASSARWH